VARLTDLVVVSGYSGAGKSSAMNVFEDAGYFTVDNLPAAMIRQLAGLFLHDGSKVERGIHAQSVAKWLERMGDHATNLAEQVVFMVKGKDIRHLTTLEGSSPAASPVPSGVPGASSVQGA